MNGIGNAMHIPKYVDHTKTQQVEPRVQQESLASQATANEQRARDNAAQNNGLLSSPPQQVIAPSTDVVNQLEKLASNRFPDNANGLGRTAIQSYAQYNGTSSTESLSGKVKVDLTA